MVPPDNMMVTHNNGSAAVVAELSASLVNTKTRILYDKHLHLFNLWFQSLPNPVPASFGA
jgi:hypothetical protein